MTLRRVPWVIVALLFVAHVAQGAISPLCTADTQPLPALVEVSGEVRCTSAGTTEIVVGVDLVIQCITAATLNGFRFLVEDGANVRVTGNDITFQGSETLYSGGVFKVDNGTVTFESAVTFNQNSAETGGAILHKNGAINFLSTATFTDNVASMSGGAIATFEGADSTITFSSFASFTGNTAGSGGAVSLLAGTITLGDNAVFEENAATTKSFSYDVQSASSGGAIYVGAYDDFTAGTLIVKKNATFIRNTATYYGGGVFLESGQASFGNNASFIDNHAYYGGGAAFFRNTTLGHYAMFVGNTAFNTSLDDGFLDDGYGGGLYARTTSELSSTGNSSVITVGKYAYFQGNAASGRGGGIMNARAILTLDDFATISDNYAKIGVGGGVFMIYGISITTIGDGVNFINNTADTGGAYLAEGTSTFLGRANFQNNLAGDGGGGALFVYAEDSAVFFMGPTFFVDNHVPNSGDGYNGGLGGAVKCSGNIEFHDTVTFEGNSGSIGGAFLLFDEAPPSRSSSPSRVEAYIANADFYGDVHFYNNAAEIQGGALNVETGGSANFWGNTYFSGNLAKRGGGAYINTKYAQSSDDRNASLSNAVFSKNFAELGGGMYVQSGTSFIMTNVSFYDNVALQDGGGPMYLMFTLLGQIHMQVVIQREIVAVPLP